MVLTHIKLNSLKKERVVRNFQIKKCTEKTFLTQYYYENMDRKKAI